MMKFNREQIIKALECCSDCDCYNAKMQEDCPLINVPFCKNYLRKQSLALIKKLTEENETLRGLYEHNSQLAIDSERKLEQCKKSYEGELSRAHMLLSMAWESVEAKDKLLGTIKADTVQKMQERLNERIDQTINVFDFQISECTAIRQALRGVKNDIYQIAKEVLEENK